MSRLSRGYPQRAVIKRVMLQSDGAGGTKSFIHIIGPTKAQIYSEVARITGPFGANENVTTYRVRMRYHPELRTGDYLEWDERSDGNFVDLKVVEMIDEHSLHKEHTLRCELSSALKDVI